MITKINGKSYWLEMVARFGVPSIDLYPVDGSTDRFNAYLRNTMHFQGIGTPLGEVGTPAEAIALAVSHYLDPDVALHAGMTEYVESCIASRGNVDVMRRDDRFLSGWVRSA